MTVFLMMILTGLIMISLGLLRQRNPNDASAVPWKHRALRYTLTGARTRQSWIAPVILGIMMITCGILGLI